MYLVSLSTELMSGRTFINTLFHQQGILKKDTVRATDDFAVIKERSVRKFIISNMVHSHISFDVGKHEGAEEGSSRFESDYCTD